MYQTTVTDDGNDDDMGIEPTPLETDAELKRRRYQLGYRPVDSIIANIIKKIAI